MNFGLMQPTVRSIGVIAIISRLTFTSPVSFHKYLESRGRGNKECQVQFEYSSTYSIGLHAGVI